MKKIFLALFSAAALLGAGCAKINVAEGQLEIPDGEMLVNLGFTGPEGIGTRSYVSGTEEAISSIAMLCFDGEGKFITERDATVTPSTELPATKGTLTGTVPANTCRIHFVANFSGLNLSSFGMGTLERTMMKSEALSSGIEDEVRFWGYRTESSASAMKTWLSGGNTVMLLRDRAKVVLVKDLNSGADEITELSWTIGNGLNRGYVAPTSASGNNPYTNNYTTANRLTEYTASGRYGYSEMNNDESIWVGDGEPQFLFENANTTAAPVKIVIKAKYADNTEKFHTVLLQSDAKVLYPVMRNQTFNLTVKNLPKSVGSSSLEDALNTTEYSNNPYAQVAREVDEVNDEGYTLKVEKTNVMFNEDGNGVVFFTYTAHGEGDISDFDESNFDVTWEAKSDDDDTDDVVAEDGEDLAVPTVSFNSTTGAGSITFPLATLTGDLKHNTLQIVALNSGLSRYVDVYSISNFSFKTNPELVDNNSMRTSGGKDREVYKLTFALPDNLPTSQYPLHVKMYSSTLSPFSDSEDDTPSGSFNVAVASTSGLLETTQTSAWNYGAKSWNNYYEYVIEGPSSSNSYTIYLNEVVENLNRSISTVGLYFEIEGFGGAIPLSCAYGFINVAPESQTVSYDVTNATFEVRAPRNTAWTVSVPAGVTANPSSGTGTRSVTITFGANTTTSTRNFTATVSAEGLPSKTVTVIQGAGASFRASDFYFSNNSSSSTKSGVTVDLTNSSKSGNYMTMGYYEREWEGGFIGGGWVYTYYPGTITVTPPSGKTITSVIVTYRSANSVRNGTVAATSSPSGYAISGAEGTWSGTASAGSSVIITMGRTNNNFPEITRIEVLYE